MSFIVLSLASCDSSSDKIDPVFSKIVLNNPKTLVVMGKSSSRSRADVGGSVLGEEDSDRNILFEILQDGTIQAVPFYDENDNELKIDIQKIINLSEVYFAMIFTFNYQRYQVIVNKNDCRMFDVTGYDLKYARMRGDILYIIDSRTLYAINLLTLEAQPLNNPEYDPVDTSSSNVLPFFIYNDEIIATSINLFYVDLTIPHDEGIHVFTDKSMARTLIGDNYIFNILFIWDVPTQKRTLGYFETVLSKTAGEEIQQLDEVLISEDAGSDFIIQSTSAVNYTPYQKYYYWIYQNGFYRMTISDTGVPAYTSLISKTIPLWGTVSLGNSRDMSNLKLYGSILFAKEGDTIYKFDLENDSEYTAVLNVSDVRDWWVASGRIFFTKYVDAVTIDTYVLSADYSTVVRISQSEMEVKNIVEFILEIPVQEEEASLE